jgi:beta-glucosidase
MKFIIIWFLLIVSFSNKIVAQDKKTVAHIQNQKMDLFIKNLMSKMTVEEKIGQLNLLSVGFDITGPKVSKNVDEKIRNGFVGGVFNTYTPIAVRKLQEIAVTQTRLKIPLIFGYDVIHGHRTIFPIPLGLAASWDLNAIEKSARIAADEAGADGLNWVFSPMVDIARDPRWGRIAEGAGEDTWLGSMIAKAMVKGYQGNELADNNTVMACVKHFALYGAIEAGRDYNSVDMSQHKMFEEYLPPYKAALDAGAGSVMSSFNEINGVPSTANKWLMTDLLRKQWAFKGFVVSDASAISELISHGIAKDRNEAGMLALNAGIDMDMSSEIYLNNLHQLLKDKKITIEEINAACRMILEAKYKLGLFEDPYRYTDEKRAEQTLMKKEYTDAARDIARKSFVLLKNKNQTLPLKSKGTIALIGPLAKSQRDVIGNWKAAGDWTNAISVEQGLKNFIGSNAKIIYAKGANISDDTLLLKRLNAKDSQLDIDNRSPEDMIDEAVKIAIESDVIVAVVGEGQGMSGEAASRSEIGLPGKQLDLLKALKETGKPLIIVLMNGRPLTLKWEDDNADAILETWFAGSQAGNAIADVLFGVYNPSGKITASFPQNVGQIPIYYNHKNTGRPYSGKLIDKYKSRYLDVSNEPLYPFGYGLSYTSFKYSELKLSKKIIGSSDSLDVAVTVSNTGNYDGEEIVQLYIQDLVGSVTRPVKELKNFKKIFLKSGQSQTVYFPIKEKDLRFYDINMEYISEPGDFKVFVGTNSRDVQETDFKLLK